MSEPNVESLLDVVAAHEQVLILPHNDPDPDAIAGAVGLRELFSHRLGIQAQIGYRGIIGRAENKAMVHYLGRPLQLLTGADLHQLPIVLVDTQPGAGNNALSDQSTLLAVVDHHTRREPPAAAPYVDLRPALGATSTIVTGYLQAAGVEPDAPLATALFYGIKTDTMGLSRGASAEDVDAYLYLQARIDVEALVGIERAQVRREYFQVLDAAMHAARVYENAVLAYVGVMSWPDLTAEMADFFLRLQGVEWVVCSGVFKDTLMLSIRTRSRCAGAGTLAQRIVGQQGSAGGHGVMAGGQVPLRGQDGAQVAKELGELALRDLGIDPRTEPRPIIA
jgi:nanoRNase/pAp phosphatase (c-di-AMP/oligoRNAs hydrolase)